jgi:hypothetical protein
MLHRFIVVSYLACPSVKKVIKEIEAIFNRSGLTVNIEIKKTNIMLGLYGGDDLDVTIYVLYSLYYGYSSYIM